MAKRDYIAEYMNLTKGLSLDTLTLADFKALERLRTRATSSGITIAELSLIADMRRCRASQERNDTTINAKLYSQGDNTKNYSLEVPIHGTVIINSFNNSNGNVLQIGNHNATIEGDGNQIGNDNHNRV